MLDNRICQIGIVVRDIEATVQEYKKVFGIEPSANCITDTYDKSHTHYKGAPTEARAKLAFFDFGQVQLELIEPVGGPSTWSEHLECHGEGVHHIAFKVSGMERVVADLAGKGQPSVQRGDYSGGRYAYVDATPGLKLILELLEND